MKYKRAAHLFIIVLLSAVLLAGCVNGNGTNVGPPGPEDQGALVAFEYNYGSYYGGEWDFKITNQAEDGAAPQYFLTAKGYNGVDLDAEGPVSAYMMDDLAEIIRENGIASWNGFDDRDDDVLDGYGFGLTAEFEDGVIVAGGYEKYPKDYEQGHTALASFLTALADNL